MSMCLRSSQLSKGGRQVNRQVMVMRDCSCGAMYLQRGSRTHWLKGTLAPDVPGESSASAAHWLCAMGKVLKHLRASASSSGE